MGIASTTAIQEFIGHWQSLCKGELVPALADFLETPAPTLQPNVILVDVVADDRLHVRLIGTGLVELIGRELTKTDALDLYAAPLRQRALETCQKMVRQPCGQLSERLTTTARGLIVPATTVALPLRTRTGINCLAGYTAAREAVDVGDSVFSIKEITAAEWIDIGAGVPSQR